MPIQSFTLPQMLNEVRSEVARRMQYYPELVRNGEMTQAEAMERIACMEYLAGYLERLLR